MNFDILHRSKKSVQMIICWDEMLGDNDRDQTVKQDDTIVASAKEETKF